MEVGQKKRNRPASVAQWVLGPWRLARQHRSRKRKVLISGGTLLRWPMVHGEGKRRGQILFSNSLI